MKECIFCKIASKQVPTEVVYETEEAMVFPDIHPKAPLHLLVIPKRHIPSLNEAKEEKELLGDLLLALQKVAEQKEKKGYRVQIHVGKEGGQEIDHLHLHLLAN